MFEDINSYCLTSDFYKKIDNTVNPNLLHLLYNKSEEYIVLYGGTRSGKTYSILQYLLYLALTSPKKQVISVVSITLNHLRKGAMRDFANILEQNKIIYTKNKTTNTFYIRDSIIEFFSVDDEGKARGAQRDILFANEANLIDYEILQQLFMRTSQQKILDFNPTNAAFLETLINEKKIKKENILKTTYLDNVYLSEQQKREIESLYDFFGEVYKKGNFVTDQDIVFSRYNIITDEEYNSMREKAKIVVVGIDFGEGVSPHAAVEVFKVDNKFYAKEIFYQNTDLDSLLHFLLSIKDSKTAFVSDYSQKHAFEFLSKKIRLTKCKKIHLQTSFLILNNLNINIAKSSANLIRESQTLRIKNHQTFNLAGADHALDALRYAVHTFL